MVGRRESRPDDILQAFDRFYRKVKDMHQRNEVPDEPLVWGYSYRRGADGKGQLTPFGDVAENGSGACEPVVGAKFDGERGPVRFDVEMPGAEKRSLHILAAEGNLRVEGQGYGRHYVKDVLLPEDLVPESATASFENGILTVTFERQQVEKMGYEVPVA